jgi:hypothetical protein
VLFDFQANDFLGGNKRRIDFSNLTTTQTEGICYINGKNMMISTEKSPTFEARVFRFNTSRWTDDMTMTGEWKNLSRSELQVIENLVSNQTLKLLLTYVLKGDYRIDITNATGKIVFQTSRELKRNKEQLLTVSLAGLENGTYSVSLISNHHKLSETFIIQ